MNLSKPLTVFIIVFGVFLTFSLFNHSGNSNSKQQIIDKSNAASEVTLAASEAEPSIDTRTPSTKKEVSEKNVIKKEDIPFKVHSQNEYNQETQELISLVQEKLSDIYQKNVDTQYRIMCLELPIMVYTLKSFSDANPEYSDPKVSFEALLSSVEDVQHDVVGSCN